jgi:tRNA1Val (adenine37-N6)-methyltransferase
MSAIFKFKQFNVDQSGCAMKINTDGVLLGALAEADQPQNILDIGTGTGVIALMLAQRFTNARVDAVEIDQSAAETAGRNFQNSSFADRLATYPSGFMEFFDQYPDKKYDLIVSNPPFYINSLKSPQESKQLAKHADQDFFNGLIFKTSKHLTAKGLIYLILPLDTNVWVKDMASKNGLFVSKTTSVFSFENSEPHREIMVLSSNDSKIADDRFVIYESPKIYTKQYQDALKDFFTIF